MPSKQSFAPVVDRATRLLILGSLPGDASLAQQQYYAHPQNRFWHLLSDVLQVELVKLDYASRLHNLLAHRVGLWDVIAQAQRRGSLDSQIRNRTDNDLLALINTLPHLQAIAFNGATAAKIGHKLLAASVDKYANKYQILSLPSSSPAYTLAYPLKLNDWMHLRDFL